MPISSNSHTYTLPNPSGDHAYSVVRSLDAHRLRHNRSAYLTDMSIAKDCADHLERESERILHVLTRHESFEAAVGELESSIDALRSLDRELAHLPRRPVESIAVFLPINLPLYSLILFAAIPSLMADRVDVRLPAATPDWLADVVAATQLDTFFPRMRLHVVTRRQFIEGFASQAEAVVFTGRYESAEEVRAQCPSSLFIFQGSGVNPIVIGADAHLSDEDLDRIITSRVFNGGQDCAAPDAFLVHASVASAFVSPLIDRVAVLPVGTYDDKSVRIGTILNPGPLKELAARLAVLQDDVVVGGNVDRAKCFVEPTVVVRPLSEHDELSEFFAPIFYVLIYENDEELREFFARPEYTENAMYVSLFGQKPVAGIFETSTVLFGKTVLDVEQGNTAFGGNGAKSNYVAFGDQKIVGPVLISQALGQRPDDHGRFCEVAVS